MPLTKDDIRHLLREKGLRVTAPRLAVVTVLSEAEGPLSHTEVLQRLGKTRWDPATVYRNLVKLREAGIAPVASRMEGIDRYALAGAEGGGHSHPHFHCEDCGRVACLPEEVVGSFAATGPWAESIQRAMVQLRGECPDCIAEAQ